MDLKLSVYLELEKLFEENKHFLFLVGGTVRDYLLGKPLEDMDAVSDATPDEMVKFLKDYDDTFKKFGSIKVIFKNVKFDITTLRKEIGYSDSRHPNKVVFTKNIDEDVIRRDVTVNALYLNKDLEVIDLVNGKQDLKNNLLRLIGNKDMRLIEDPLRIFRILRFSVDYQFKIEEETFAAIKRNKLLVTNLNKDKIKQEINKCKNKQELITLMKLLNINIDL